MPYSRTSKRKTATTRGYTKSKAYRAGMAAQKRRTAAKKKRYIAKRKAPATKARVVSSSNVFVRAPRAPNAFAPFKRATLIYSDNILKASVPAGQAGVHVFSGNNVGDPDFTNVGHQPRYYDSLALHYSRVRVLSSHITCTLRFHANVENVSSFIFRQAAEATQGCKLDFYGTTSTQLIGNLGVTQRWGEVPGMVMQDVGWSIVNHTSVLKSGGSYFKLFVDNDKELGSQAMNNTIGSVLAPDNSWQYVVGFVNNNNATSPLWDLTVRIAYDCLFYDPVLPTTS